MARFTGLRVCAVAHLRGYAVYAFALLRYCAAYGVYGISGTCAACAVRGVSAICAEGADGAEGDGADGADGAACRVVPYPWF